MTLLRTKNENIQKNWSRWEVLQMVRRDGLILEVRGQVPRGVLGLILRGS